MSAAASFRDESLKDLPERYRLVLCDVWGVVHDGVTVFADARSVLLHWRGQGRIVLLLTNAPRPSEAVRAQLDRFGLPQAAYSAVVTSGDAGLAALRAAGQVRAGFIGTEADRRTFESAGIEFLDGPDGEIVVCTGLGDGSSDPAGYDDVLAGMLRRGAMLYCLNPDRVVLRGGVPEPCAGAIAERYERMGGHVEWFGKPYAPIYERCLEVAAGLAGRAFQRSEVVAVGDSLRTDFVGAADSGFDFLFITHGIEGEMIEREGVEAVIARFERKQGISLPQPVAVAPKLR